MKWSIALAASVAVFGVASAGNAFAEPAGAVFPGNEAVRIVAGKRVVEEPPMTPGMLRLIKAGLPLPKPNPSGEVFMVEGRNALMECGAGAITDSGCIGSTLGKEKRRRFWTVKLKGEWMNCTTRAPKRNCDSAKAGMPGSLALEE